MIRNAGGKGPTDKVEQADNIIAHFAKLLKATTTTYRAHLEMDGQKLNAAMLPNNRVNRHAADIVTATAAIPLFVKAKRLWARHATQRTLQDRAEGNGRST